MLFRTVVVVVVVVVVLRAVEGRDASDFGPIGQLHDDVILLQLPESFSLLFSCAN